MTPTLRSCALVLAATFALVMMTPAALAWDPPSTGPGATCQKQGPGITFQVPQPSDEEWVIPGVLAVVSRPDSGGFFGVYVGTGEMEGSRAGGGVGATTSSAECAQWGAMCLNAWAAQFTASGIKDPEPLQSGCFGSAY